MKKHLAKKMLLILVVCLVAFTLSGCNTTETSKVEPTQAEATQVQETEKAIEKTVEPSKTEEVKAEETEEPSVEMTFTLEELNKFDGQNGNSAYIAIDGVVYDVTKVSQWMTGKHRGEIAGQDLSDKMKSSPHGIAKLLGIPIVGKLDNN